ncbi:MAG TPA: hypothetical protein PLZ57_06020 [Pseudobdellovibrionaceae bacterium]|nr:hypothetical protein [Pseudobdellovibrionaceae bacterium]
MSRLLKRAVRAIEKHGALLVFPLNNRPAPLSLWHVLHPDLPMRWEWSDDGDDAVVQMWHLRRELMESGQVYYGKYIRGRATVLSLSVFEATWKLTAPRRQVGLLGEAAELAEVLEADSPQSTRQLRQATDLGGRVNEARYQAAMKRLWSEMWIAGVGEVDEGAFPSLAHAWTESVLEDYCRRGMKLSEAQARGRWANLSNQRFGP